MILAKLQYLAEGISKYLGMVAGPGLRLVARKICVRVQGGNANGAKNVK